MSVPQTSGDSLVEPKHERDDDVFAWVSRKNDLSREPFILYTHCKFYHTCSFGKKVEAEVTLFDKREKQDSDGKTWIETTCCYVEWKDVGKSRCRKHYRIQHPVTEQMRELQRSSPTTWGMTLRQWHHFVNECKRSRKYPNLKIAGKKPHAQYVDLRDFNCEFVKPFTRRLGCGLALLMNPEGKEADFMLSHAWNEDMEECQQALEKFQKDEALDIDSIAVWFCAFSQYQPEDFPDTTINCQLSLDPFKQVISNLAAGGRKAGGRMLCIHTTREDIYGRLWCVHEMDVALDKSVRVAGVFSEAYTDYVQKRFDMASRAGANMDIALQVAGLKVCTANAKCSPDDEERLIKQVLDKPGGFERIDKSISQFRECVVLASLSEADNQEAIQRLQNMKDLVACEQLRTLAGRGNSGARKALQDLAKEGNGIAKHMLSCIDAEVGEAKARYDAEVGEAKARYDAEVGEARNQIRGLEEDMNTLRQELQNEQTNAKRNAEERQREIDKLAAERNSQADLRKDAEGKRKNAEDRAKQIQEEQQRCQSAKDDLERKIEEKRNEINRVREQEEHMLKQLQEEQKSAEQKRLKEAEERQSEMERLIAEARNEYEGRVKDAEERCWESEDRARKRSFALREEQQRHQETEDRRRQLSIKHHQLEQNYKQLELENMDRPKYLNRDIPGPTLPSKSKPRPGAGAPRDVPSPRGRGPQWRETVKSR